MGISFQNVSFSYDRIASETLKNVNLQIERENEFITILGHTGSGKSTLVQLMNALNLPLEGMVEVAGIKIYPKNKELLKPVRRHVGLVFQFPEYQLFEETVLKDVMFGPKNFLGKDAFVLEEAKLALKMVNLDPALYDRSPFNLSGGQMRRVAIAGILASSPNILVLDEPTVGLDPKGKVELLEMLVKIQKETSKTIIIITHDMNLVARYSKRCIVLDEGEIVYDGQKEEMFENEKFLEKHNLSLPDVSKLAKTLKNKGLIRYNKLPLTKEELFKVITRGDNYE
jgi:energy-coupling factor transport system ATP-binding protein